MFSGEKKAPAAAAEGRKKLGSGTRAGFWIPETGFRPQVGGQNPDTGFLIAGFLIASCWGVSLSD